MSIYLITNRSISNNRISTSGKERGSSSFRIARCSIDSTAKMEDAVSYELLKDIDSTTQYRKRRGSSKPQIMTSLLDKIENLKGSERLFAELYQSLSNAEDGCSDVLFFIHGFANDMDSTLKNIYQLNKLYIEPKDSPIEHLVYFSWPTIGHMALTYWNDQEDAQIAGMVVARIFSLLRGFYIDMFEIGAHERCKHRIHLMAHSMGNQVLAHALESIGKSKLFQVFEEVFLLNADVEYDVFEPNEPFARLTPLSERTTMYTHRSDDALRISRFTKNFNRRLGSKGPMNPEKLAEDVFVVDTTNAKQDLDTSFFSSVKEKTIDHWGYLYRSAVINDIKAVMRGEDEQLIAGRTVRGDSRNLYQLDD
jgi:esterase/lipase superfamily enzyme